MKKIFLLVLLIPFLIACQTTLKEIPTTPILDDAIGEAGTITTQIVEVEKIVTKIVTDDTGKKNALDVIGKLKSDAITHEKTLNDLKKANDLFSERYWTVVKNYNKQKEKIDSLRGNFWLAVSIILVLISIILLPFYKKIIKFFSKLFF